MGEQESSNMFETLTMFVHVHALEVQFARTWSHVLRREPMGKGGGLWARRGVCIITHVLSIVEFECFEQCESLGWWGCCKSVGKVVVY